jgi:hypothetical protein
MKDLCIYSQSWQSNGYYPVECFKRINGKWYIGICKIDKDRKHYFNMLETGYNNEGVLYLLINGYSRFSKKEMFDSDKMHKHDLSIDDISKLIND